METIHILSNSFQIFLGLSPTSLEWGVGCSDLPEVAESHGMTRIFHQDGLLFATLLDWNRVQLKSGQICSCGHRLGLELLTYEGAWVFIRSVGTAALHLPI